MKYDNKYIYIDDLFKIDEYKAILKDKKYLRNKFLNKEIKKFYSFFKNAEKRGIPFNITYYDYLDLLCNNCSYCNKSNANSIDRVDSSKGYIKNNIQLLCNKCNIMKYTYSEKEFLDHINVIYNHIYK